MKKLLLMSFVTLFSFSALVAGGGDKKCDKNCKKDCCKKEAKANNAKPAETK